MEKTTDETKKEFDGKAVIVFDVTDKAITELEKAWPASAIPKDLSVKEDYNLVKEGESTLRKLRTSVETRRKELKADALAYGRNVDATANSIKERLLAIEEPLKLARKTYDEKIELEKREKIRLEEERVQGIANRIAKIRASVEANISSDSATISGVIDSIAGKPEDDVEEIVGEWAQEFKDKALLTINETIDKLLELHAMKKQSEQAAEIAAEQEKKRLADEEEARVKREKELADDAAKVAADKAEMKKQQDALQAERDALAKEKADIQAAKDAEAKKVADKKAAEADKKRLADIEKKKKADAKAAKKEVEKRTKEAEEAIPEYVDFSNGTYEEICHDIINAIKNGKIPHVTFE